MNFGAIAVDTAKFGDLQVDKIMFGSLVAWENIAPNPDIYEEFFVDGTFNVPVGVTQITALVSGGGGNGEGNGSMGGRAGQVIHRTMQVTPGIAIAVTVSPSGTGWSSSVEHASITNINASGGAHGEYFSFDYPVVKARTLGLGVHYSGLRDGNSAAGGEAGILGDGGRGTVSATAYDGGIGAGGGCSVNDSSAGKGGPGYVRFTYKLGEQPTTGKEIFYHQDDNMYFTPSAGVTQVNVLAIGSGGSGARAEHTGDVAGGGHAGTIVSSTIAVTPGDDQFVYTREGASGSRSGIGGSYDGKAGNPTEVYSLVAGGGAGGVKLSANYAGNGFEKITIAGTSTDGARNGNMYGGESSGLDVGGMANTGTVGNASGGGGCDTGSDDGFPGGDGYCEITWDLP